VSDVTSRGIVQYLGDYWEMRDLEMTEKFWENIAKGAAFKEWRMELGLGLGMGGKNWISMWLGLGKGWEWDGGLEGIYVGVVVGFRVEVGAEVGKGWLG